MKKATTQIVSSLFPSYFTRKAYKFLVNPQVKKLRPHELHVLDRATQNDFPFGEYTIKTYTWNEGHEPILLIHGWEGQAGNFADLIEALITQGFTVHSFDGPSHGFSSKGATSLLEFTELVAVMIRNLEVKKLVSHSFGGVAVTYALWKNQDLEIDRYALLTVPDRFLERIDQVSEEVGISEKVKTRLVDGLEKQFDFKASELNVSNWVKEIKVSRACIWHGNTDKVIPLSISSKVHRAWPQSDFRVKDDIGHFRILRTKEVIEEVVDFLKK